MLKKLFLLVTLSLSFGSSGMALNLIDTFIRDHCGNLCTGDSDACRICQNEAVDLYDQATINAPDGGVELRQGKIEFTF